MSEENKTMTDEEIKAEQIRLMLKLKELEDKGGFQFDKRDAAGLGIGAALGAGVYWLFNNI